MAMVGTIFWPTFSSKLLVYEYMALSTFAFVYLPTFKAYGGLWCATLLLAI